MLTETPLTIPTDRDHRPAVGVSADPRDVPGAAHEARAARIERAFDAVEALGRRRRAQELVEAIERLGAGLGTTMVALDDAVAAVVDAHHPALPAAPTQRALEMEAWTPISEPIVPITTFIAAPAVQRAPVVAPVPVAVPAAVAAPVPVAVAAPAPVAPAPAVADEAPARPRRQAPAGLAAFVIDFPEITG